MLDSGHPKYMAMFVLRKIVYAVLVSTSMCVSVCFCQHDPSAQYSSVDKILIADIWL